VQDTCWLVASAASSAIRLGVFAGHLDGLPTHDMAAVQLLEYGLQAFERREGDEPTLLAIDRADLLDDCSATLVECLVRRHHVVLLATVTTAVPAWLIQLSCHAEIQFLELSPCTRSDCDALVREQLGGAVSPAVLDGVWSLTAGNRTEIVDIVGAGRANGVLIHDRTWRLRGALDLTPRTAARFNAMMGGFSDEARRLLDLVALVDSAPLRLVEDLCSPELIERLEADELVTVVRDKRRMRVEFVDARLRTHMANSIPAMRCRILTKKSIEWFFAMRCRRTNDALAVARTSLESGIPLSPDLAVSAAERALDLFEPVIAERICRAVTSDESNAELQLLLARSLTAQGQHVDSQLTSRQTQIALLAGTYSNAEIAQRLSISRRTVENHLNAAFQALGVHDRSELSDALGITL